MIDTQVYKKILEEGLLLDHYNILITVRDGKELPKTKRIEGFINLLHKKGYMEEGSLTEKGQSVIGEKEVQLVKQDTVVAESSKSFNFAVWVIALHKKCEAKIQEITGKRQVRDSINGKYYSFLPNPTDLGKSLMKVVNLYKISDYDKVEKVILSYIDKCATSKNWFPILQYYISKNNMSTMVTDMENMDEDDEKSNDTIVNI